MTTVFTTRPLGKTAMLARRLIFMLGLTRLDTLRVDVLAFGCVSQNVSYIGLDVRFSSFLPPRKYGVDDEAETRGNAEGHLSIALSIH